MLSTEIQQRCSFHSRVILLFVKFEAAAAVMQSRDVVRDVVQDFVQDVVVVVF